MSDRNMEKIKNIISKELSNIKKKTSQTDSTKRSLFKARRINHTLIIIPKFIPKKFWKHTILVQLIYSKC